MIRTIVALVLIFIATNAQAAWLKAESDHFVVYSNTDPQRLTGFVRDVERFSAMLQHRTAANTETDSGKLTIFIVSNQGAVERAMGKGARNVAGFYNANIMGAYAVVPRNMAGGQYDLDAQTVLYHEYAHHFMLQHFPGGYPAWFVEGFAEFYSTTDFKPDGTIAIGMPAMHRAYSLGRDEIFPLQRMLATETGKLSDWETERFYGWAWMLTHYLTFDDARKGQLAKYLAAFAKGDTPEKAASDAFGDIATLQSDLLRYRLQRQIQIKLMTGFTPPEPKITVASLEPADAEMMPLLIHFVQGSDNKGEVDAFLASARKLAARFPGNPTGLEMLSEGELDGENLDAAMKANDELLALQPLNARALLRRSRIAMTMMQKSGFPGGWSAVRKLIVKANRTAPNDPFPLQVYYQSFQDAGEQPPEIAVKGLARALELAPQVAGLRMMYAARLIKDGKRDNARGILAPVLNDPHSADLRAVARAMLDPPVPASKEGTSQKAK